MKSIKDEDQKHVDTMVGTLLEAKTAYNQKNRDHQMYWLANASGHPPQMAIIRDGWPKKESISNSKTSAGMDRTDDIKKGIYQVSRPNHITRQYEGIVLERMIAKLKAADCQVVIPPKTNRTEQRLYDEEMYKWRHLIENFFQKLKQYRGIAARYDKTASNFLGAIHLVASVIWLK